MSVYTRRIDNCRRAYNDIQEYIKPVLFGQLLTTIIVTTLQCSIVELEPEFRKEVRKYKEETEKNNFFKLC